MSRLSKNILYNLLGQITILILGFISVKRIFNQLGADILGIIYFTQMINLLFRSVLERGISSTIIREVSGDFKSDSNYIRKFIRTFSLYYWIAYFILAVAIFFLAAYIAQNWINLKTLSPVQAIFMLRVLGISVLLTIPINLYSSLFCGIQRMEYNNVMDVSFTAIQQFGTIIILLLGGDVVYVVYGTAICYILKLILYFILTTRFFPMGYLVPGYFPAVIQKNSRFTLSTVFISVLATIHNQIDNLLMSKLLPISAVGYYGAAYGNVSKGKLLASSISRAAYPTFSALFKEGDHDKIKTQYQKLQDVVCFGIVPIYAVIPFIFIPLFSYLFNQEIAHLLLLPTIFLCISAYMNGTLSIPHIVTLAMGKPGIVVRQNIYALFVVLPATIFFISQWGLKGAGLSTVFYHLFAYGYIVPKFSSACLKLPAPQWYKHILKIVALTTMTYGFLWLIMYKTSSFSVFGLILGYCLASILYLLGSFFMIGDELKKILIQHAQFLVCRLGFKNLNTCLNQMK